MVVIQQQNSPHTSQSIQFRQPLPPPVGVRMSLQQPQQEIRFQPGQPRPGQVRKNIHYIPLKCYSYPNIIFHYFIYCSNFLCNFDIYNARLYINEMLTFFQPMDPQFRMVLQQRGQLVQTQQMPMQQGPPHPQPGASTTPQGQAPPKEQSPTTTASTTSTTTTKSNESGDLANLQSNDLNDLGVHDEDLLGMADDFNILEFADALDEGDSSNKTNILDELQAEEEDAAAKAADESQTKRDESSNANAANPPPPPPYTAASAVRGPPPPYPGGQQQQPKVPQQPNKVSTQIN